MSAEVFGLRLFAFMSDTRLVFFCRVWAIK